MDNDGVVLKVSMAADKVGKQIKETNKDLDDMGSKLDKISKLTTNAFKTTGIIAFTKAIGNILTSMMNASKAQAEYAESVNLLNNAYGSVNNSGRELIDTMEYFYGLDPSNVTRQLGVFRQMSNAMNIANKDADMLSENFVKMAEDVSSLYNIDFNVATKKLQSGFAGQVRPLRELGADITQAALQQELYNRGINESVTNLNRASKSVLIYLTLERQLSNAQGDAANTIESMSNQMRVFKEQVAMAGRQIGAVFIPILKAILPIANAILMVFNDIMSIILTFLGADVDSIAPDINKASKSYYDFGDALDGVGGSAKSTNKALKDLEKTSLRSFDKLNNIQTPQSASGGSSGGAGGGVGKVGGVDSRLLNSLKEYNSQLDGTLMKARKIADWIEKWLIYTDDAGKKHLTWLGKALTFLGIGGLIYKGGKAIYNVWKGVSGLLGKLGIGKAAAEGASGVAEIGASASGAAIAIAGAVGVALTLARAAQLQIGSLKEGKNLWDSWYNLSGGVSGILVKINAELIQMANFPILAGASKLLATLDRDYDLGLGKKLKDLIYVEFPTLGKEIEYLNEQATKSIAPQLANLNMTRRLTDGLEQLFDTQGKVKKGELYRAEYVLETLNKQLGTNYKIVKGQITQDGKVIKNIKEIIKQTDLLILRKQAEMMLNAQEENYNKALKLRNERYKAIEDTQKRLNELKENEIFLTDEQKEKNDILIGVLKNNLLELKSEYKTTNAEVTRYEDLIAAAETGNTEMMEKLMKDYGFLVGSEAKKAEEAVDGIPDQVDIGVLVDTHEIDGKNGIKAKTKKQVDEANKYTIKPKVEFDAQSIVNSFTAVNKKYKMKVDTDKNGYVNISYTKKANGGFVDEGELFMAREAGPEMVGRIGNRTAVANNDQIVEAISIGVAKAMSGTNRNTNVVIEANGDTQGLMNFINFKQKEQNRQFGL